MASFVKKPKANFDIPAAVSAAFTPDEIKQYQRTFKGFDSDCDGTIDQNELKSALGQLGERPSDGQLAATMKEADVDKSGNVSFGEFMTVMLKLKGDPNSASLFKPKMNKSAGAAAMAYHSYSDEERMAFTEHINNCLAKDSHVGNRLPMTLETEQLFSEVSDGLLLCKLINQAEFDTIDTRALNIPTEAKPLTIFHMVENMNLALNAAKGIGCVVTNVNAKDIIDGNPILILGLIWQIIRIQLLSSISLTSCPELVALLTEEEELEDLLALQPEAILLRWFNHHLERTKCTKRVHNFGKDLSDGEALSYLLNVLDPQSCDLATETNATERASHIIMNAKQLGVETFIRPNDITGANRKLLLAFVAQLFNTNPNLIVEPEKLQEFAADFANLDLDDRGDTREEKVFRMWMNSLGIDSGALYITNLFSDIQDGVAILKVMDTIQPGIVDWKKVNLEPKNRFKKVENGNYVILCAKAMDLTVVNVGGLDIIDGNKKMTLAIMWQLMRKHTLNLLQGLSKGKKKIEDPEIVRWANSKSVSMKIKNFNDSGLSSGVYLLKVCHGINKGVVNWDLVSMDAPTVEDKTNNAKYAISVARKLGALVFVAAEDIVEVRGRMVMLFCASLWHADNQKIATDLAEKEQAAQDAINTANNTTATTTNDESSSTEVNNSTETTTEDVETNVDNDIYTTYEQYDAQQQQANVNSDINDVKQDDNIQQLSTEPTTPIGNINTSLNNSTHTDDNTPSNSNSNSKQSSATPSLNNSTHSTTVDSTDDTSTI